MILLAKLIILLVVFIVLASAGSLMNILNRIHNRFSSIFNGQNNNGNMQGIRSVDALSQEINSEEYIQDVVCIVEFFGFKLTDAGKASLEYRLIDRSQFDMALAIVLAAIADDYFTQRVMINMECAQIFVVGMVRAFFDSGKIHKSAFDLAVEVITNACEKEANSYDATLAEIRRNNYLDRNGMVRICYPNIENNQRYHESKAKMKELYNDYLAERAC